LCLCACHFGLLMTELGIEVEYRMKLWTEILSFDLETDILLRLFIKTGPMPK
jgi:hypothetical protein